MAKFKGKYIYFESGSQWNPGVKAIVKVLGVGTTGGGRRSVAQFEVIWYKAHDSLPSYYHSQPIKAVKTALRNRAFSDNKFLNEAELIKHIFTGLKD